MAEAIAAKRLTNSRFQESATPTSTHEERAGPSSSQDWSCLRTVPAPARAKPSMCWATCAKRPMCREGCGFGLDPSLSWPCCPLELLTLSRMETRPWQFLKISFLFGACDADLRLRQHEWPMTSLGLDRGLPPQSQRLCIKSLRVATQACTFLQSPRFIILDAFALAYAKRNTIVRSCPTANASQPGAPVKGAAVLCLTQLLQAFAIGHHTNAVSSTSNAKRNVRHVPPPLHWAARRNLPAAGTSVAWASLAPRRHTRAFAALTHTNLKPQAGFGIQQWE